MLHGMCMWHVHVACECACGMWHVACGMWHVACGMWHVACGMCTAWSIARVHGMCTARALRAVATY